LSRWRGPDEEKIEPKQPAGDQAERVGMCAPNPSISAGRWATNETTVTRTNLEALLQHQSKRLTHQAALRLSPPHDKAVKPAKKPRTSPSASRAPKKKSASSVRPAAKASEGDGGDGGSDRGGGDGGDSGRIAITSAHEAAFARVRPAIEALPRDEVRLINVHVPSAVVLALGALPRMLALREAMRGALTEPPLEALDTLKEYALAAAHAHANVLPEDAGETELRALVNEATPLRERMLLSAEAFVSFGHFDAKRVATIRRGNGHLDTAQDLSALGTLFRNAWPTIGSKTLLTRADIERAFELNALLLEALGRRQQGTDGSGDPRETDELLAKAFELFRRAYEECRHAIVYLRRHQGDADAIAPPLAHSRRRSRRPQADEPVDNAPDPAEPDPLGPTDGEADAG
jgi:hypothetical protein